MLLTLERKKKAKRAVKFRAFHGSRYPAFKRFSTHLANTGVCSSGHRTGTFAFYFTTVKANAEYFTDAGGHIGEYELTLKRVLRSLCELTETDWDQIPYPLRATYEEARHDDFRTLVEVAYLINTNYDEPENDGFGERFDAVVVDDYVDGCLPSTIIAVISNHEDKANACIRQIATEAT